MRSGAVCWRHKSSASAPGAFSITAVSGFADQSRFCKLEQVSEGQRRLENVSQRVRERGLKVRDLEKVSERVRERGLKVRELES